MATANPTDPTAPGEGDRSTPEIRSRYSVRIRDLELSMSIGVHAHEKTAPQRVLINVLLELDYPEDGFVDGQYRRVACYETLIRQIRASAAEGHVILVETLAERIAGLALVDPRVLKAAVEVEKLDIFGDCAGVGARIEKLRR